MTKNILVLHGEGIGNCVQIFPLLRTLKECLGYNVYYCHVFGSYVVDPLMCPYVTKWLHPIELSSLNPKDFDGILSTFWTREKLRAMKNRGFKVMGKIYPINPTESEVYTYLRLAEDLGVAHKDLLWESSCFYGNRKEIFDVVLCDGYKKTDALDWSVKSYAHYEELTTEFVSKGFSVASIGSKNEYIKGTVDMTSLTFMDSLSLINNSKLLISNDTGMYHCANLMGTKNIVIFTAMSRAKNYNKYFHKDSIVMYRKDIDCAPCQGVRNWATCKDWKCKDIPVETIFNVAKEFLC